MSDRADERPRDDRPDGPHDASGEGAEADPFEHIDDEGSPEGVVGWIRWFWTGDVGSLIYIRDVLTSVAIVVTIGVLLFAASGVWPPMVAVESGSMEPNMERGDLVFLVDNDRFVPDTAVDDGGTSTGVVPADVAERNERTKFNRPGDVVVFRPNGNAGQTPIIHRAMFWVENGENWYDRADSDAVGSADDCEALSHCPAPHAGFITKGDNELTNRNYDQTTRLSAPVRPGWIVGTAEVRIPYLGHVRLLFSGATVAPLETVAAESFAETSSATNNTATASARQPAPASPRPA